MKAVLAGTCSTRAAAPCAEARRSGWSLVMPHLGPVLHEVTPAKSPVLSSPSVPRGRCWSLIGPATPRLRRRDKRSPLTERTVLMAARSLVCEADRTAMNRRPPFHRMHHGVGLESAQRPRASVRAGAFAGRNWPARTNFRDREMSSSAHRPPRQAQNPGVLPVRLTGTPAQP